MIEHGRSVWRRAKITLQAWKYKTDRYVTQYWNLWWAPAKSESLSISDMWSSIDWAQHGTTHFP